jgi:hypothetical protein
MGDENMGKPVLRTSEERKGIPGIKTHCLSTPGHRQVKGRLRIQCEFSDDILNEVCRLFVIFIGSDVREGMAPSILEGIDEILGERDLRETVVFDQLPKFAMSGVKESF